ncbi:hypothetical protein GUJ93_ZPchr0006g45126 [Zizania palustris]|uniref:Uncharacterized protein n=1 Tax=Zizania palustris TaxID=103762 RepID=A0A8J5W1G5_ZIZPA|nr:hypothetical protein GUJ93_ZPchr0006g45126 [Zizania palustris]
MRQPATGRSGDPVGEAAGGDEVVNMRPLGLHKPTQMGRFPGEGLIPAAGLRLITDHPSCYDVAGGQGGDWGKSVTEKRRAVRPPRGGEAGGG